MMTLRHLSALPNKNMHIVCVLYLRSFYCCLQEDQVELELNVFLMLVTVCWR